MGYSARYWTIDRSNLVDDQRREAGAHPLMFSTWHPDFRSATGHGRDMLVSTV